MKKEITMRQMATIKRVAQNVNPLIVKKSKLISKIDELEDELTRINNEIDCHEMGIKSLTGGLSSNEIVLKHIEDTDKVDSKGQPVKVVSYRPNFDVVRFDEEKRVYIIEDTPCSKCDCIGCTSCGDNSTSDYDCQESDDCCSFNNDYESDNNN